MNEQFDMKLSEFDFDKISNFVYQQVGIKLPKVKTSMVEGRLRRRLRAVNAKGFKDYTKFVLGPDGKAEVVYLIDAITTNKTNFFREIKHFEYLTDVLLPQLTKMGVGKNRPLRIWSAGCSSGEEPYTLAMVLHEWNRNNPAIDFSIWATDISITVLKKAKQAIYSDLDVAPVPLTLRQNYMLRSNAHPKVIKMSLALRDKITFGVLNLKQDHYELPHIMDIIFCRNVMIYFDAKTQEGIIHRYCENMVPKGHLFLGHSEGIHGFNVPLTPMGSTIYQKHET